VYQYVKFWTFSFNFGQKFFVSDYYSEGIGRITDNRDCNSTHIRCYPLILPFTSDTLVMIAHLDARANAPIDSR